MASNKYNSQRHMQDRIAINEKENSFSVRSVLKKKPRETVFFSAYVLWN